MLSLDIFEKVTVTAVGILGGTLITLIFSFISRVSKAVTSDEVREYCEKLIDDKLERTMKDVHHKLDFLSRDVTANFEKLDMKFNGMKEILDQVIVCKIKNQE